MDWNDLRFVLAIARCGTLSSAARELGVSHTTAGRRLQAIEDALGVRLFERTPDGFIPTMAGEEVVEVAGETEQKLHALESRVLGQDKKLSGELRVTTMDIFFIQFHDIFTAFTERYPNIELTIMSSNEEASLTRREADVALRMTKKPPEYLVGRRVGNVQFAVYGASELVARAGPDATWSDFPWLSWDKRMNLRFIDEWLKANAPGANVVARVNFDSVLIRETIARGVGVHFLSCLDGDSDPRLTRIGPILEEYGSELWLLTLAELRKTSRVRAFIDFMHERLSERQRALLGK